VFWCALSWCSVLCSLQAFHVACWALAASAVARSLRAVWSTDASEATWTAWVQLVVAEVALGVVASFFFNAFHECEQPTVIA
jgi:hypothetical protein